ncbi:LacI family DNA-binding transcriptional regulator [Candidatus Kaistella beijingensis]|uniref:LacI family DNA-binding transcriptional regulator n=1 Tax=Candidatus Kaistella beijingensis TaxID=2820270 RepID=UPI001CC65E5D|nr:LacI family DNA-binding transcriptional regulator [Candidatus Kaistella beijingensis]UBB88655.1 LacI family DNA-binding transcriptional regulator [Candidatus Kaistella beijingensis]
MNNKVTIYDIAEKLNITAATVSRALNGNPNISEKTRETVLAAAKEMNYKQNKLALALKSGKSNHIGVIVPRINTNFFGSVIRGIEEELNAKGYNIIICQSHNDEEMEAKNIETLIDSHVDAIFISSSSKSSASLQKVLDEKIPLIFFDRRKIMNNVSSVTIDDFAGGYMATKHLIDSGCRKIAHIISGPIELEIFKERHRGYQQALEDHNIDYRKDYVLRTNSSIEEGKRAVEILFSLNEKPDAIFSASDFVALGAIQELQKRGIKVPDEVSVIGFANEPFTDFLELSISTIDQFPLEMGRTVARVYLNQETGDEAGGNVQKKVVLQPKLIARKSTRN